MLRGGGEWGEVGWLLRGVVEVGSAGLCLPSMGGNGVRWVLRGGCNGVGVGWAGGVVADVGWGRVTFAGGGWGR